MEPSQGAAIALEGATSLVEFCDQTMKLISTCWRRPAPSQIQTRMRASAWAPAIAGVTIARIPSIGLGTLAVGAIGLYRRHLSPLKGFRCAHHALHGCESCSEYGQKVYALRPFGLASAMMIARLRECRAAYRRLMAMTTEPPADGISKSHRRSFERRHTRWYDNCGCSGCADGALDACDCSGGLSC